jgi:hypothetical protein
MENYQVRLVDFEEKSVQEVEETLLKVHEEKTGIPQIEVAEEIKLEIPAEPDTANGISGGEQSTPQAPSFDDADVLSYIKSKYNRDIDSMEDLFKPIKSNLISTEMINQILKKPIPKILHIETRGKKKDFKSKLNSEITVPKE